MGDMVIIYVNQRRWKDAEELGTQVVKLNVKILGQEHSDTLFNMATLASTYKNQGKWKEGKYLLIQVVEVDGKKKFLGQGHLSR